MKKRCFFGIFLIILGAVAISLALMLLSQNRREDADAASVADAVLPQLQEHIAKKEQERAESDASLLPPAEHVPEAFRPTEMEELEIDGEMYIGRITIPAIELELPVISHWSYPRLKKAPCRYSGSLYTDNLVIAAHNYKRHFRNLIKLSEGDEILFTDPNGNVTLYRVYALETLPPTDVDYMKNSDAELTLFTCTYGGRERITVRAEKV